MKSTLVSGFLTASLMVSTSAGAQDAQSFQPNFFHNNIIAENNTTRIILDDINPKLREEFGVNRFLLRCYGDGKHIMTIFSASTVENKKLSRFIDEYKNNMGDFPTNVGVIGRRGAVFGSAAAMPNANDRYKMAGSRPGNSGLHESLILYAQEACKETLFNPFDPKIIDGSPLVSNLPAMSPGT